MSRRDVAIWSSVALTVTAVVVVALFGIVRPPELPTLEESGRRLPTAVAGLRQSGDEQCVVIVATDGGERAGHCVQRYSARLTVVDGDQLVLEQFEPAGRVLTVLDPETGGEVERRRSSPDGGRPEPPDGRPSVVVEETAGELEVSLLDEDGEQVLARVEDVRGYDLRPEALSPDGSWALLTDSEGRLLVAPREDGGLLVAAEDLEDPVWVP